MSVQNLIKITRGYGRRIDKRIAIDIKYNYFYNLVSLTRVDTGQLRGNTFVRRYPLVRFNSRRRNKIAGSVAHSQRAFIRPYGKDIVSQTAPYARKWASADALLVRAYHMTRAQIPGLVQRGRTIY